MKLSSECYKFGAEAHRKEIEIFVPNIYLINAVCVF